MNNSILKKALPQPHIRKLLKVLYSQVDNDNPNLLPAHTFILSSMKNSLNKKLKSEEIINFNLNDYVDVINNSTTLRALTEHERESFTFVHVCTYAITKIYHQFILKEMEIDRNPALLLQKFEIVFQGRSTNNEKVFHYHHARVFLAEILADILEFHQDALLGASLIEFYKNDLLADIHLHKEQTGDDTPVVVGCLNFLIGHKNFDPNVIHFQHPEEGSILTLLAAMPKLGKLQQQTLEKILALEQTNVNLQVEQTGMTPLMVAIQSGNFAVASLLISHPRIDIRLKNSEDKNALTLLNECSDEIRRQPDFLEVQKNLQAKQKKIQMKEKQREKKKEKRKQEKLRRKIEKANHIEEIMQTSETAGNITNDVNTMTTLEEPMKNFNIDADPIKNIISAENESSDFLPQISHENNFTTSSVSAHVSHQEAEHDEVQSAENLASDKKQKELEITNKNELQSEKNHSTKPLLKLENNLQKKLKLVKVHQTSSINLPSSHTESPRGITRTQSMFFKCDRKELKRERSIQDLKSLTSVPTWLNNSFTLEDVPDVLLIKDKAHPHCYIKMDWESIESHKTRKNETPGLLESMKTAFEEKKDSLTFGQNGIKQLKGGNRLISYQGPQGDMKTYEGPLFEVKGLNSVRRIAAFPILSDDKKVTIYWCCILLPDLHDANKHVRKQIQQITCKPNFPTPISKEDTVEVKNKSFPESKKVKLKRENSQKFYDQVRETFKDFKEEPFESDRGDSEEKTTNTSAKDHTIELEAELEATKAQFRRELKETYKKFSNKIATLFSKYEGRDHEEHDKSNSYTSKG